MVKADVRKDYYADLGLQASAEPEDIKKQFRKLALKYHPDRNPGKETEYNAKFQAIQAAHEILSDPQQRLKYDTDRLRAGYGKFYGPPKTPFPRKTQGFPYPGTPTGPAAGSTKPQTPKPNFSRPNTSSYGPSAGSQRYSAHARAGQQWQKTQDDAQTRADAFRGFSGMRGANAGANAGGAWRSFDPKTGREPSSAGGTPRQQNAPFGNHGNQRPKSAYEYFKDNVKAGDQTQSANSSAKKKQGYAPGTAGGDEPMAKNTSAYTKTRTERPSSMYFDSAPPPTSKKPAAPETPSPRPDFERASSRYAGTGGEKTFFSSTGLGRSATTRTPSGSHRASNGRANPTSPLHGEQQRHRSASPKSRRPRAYSISSDSTTSSEEAFEDIPIASEFQAGFKPKAVPKSRLRPHQNFADFHRQDDSSSGTGEDPSTRSGANSRRTAPFSKQGGPRKPWGTSAFVDLTTDSDDNKGHNSDSAAFPRNSHRPPQPHQPQGSATVYDPLFMAPRFKRLFFPYSNSSTEKMAGQQPAGFGRQSSRDTNNLHKKFSAEDWRDGLHEFDFLGARASPLSQARGQTNARPEGSASPGTGFSRNDPKSPPQNPFAQPKFSADHWAERLRDITWNTSMSGSDNDKSRQSANASPTRSPKKQARSGPKVRSGPQPASVATEAEEATETVNDHVPPGPAPGSSESNPVEAEAMDIDDELPPPPPTATTTQKNGSASAPRNTSHTDSNTNTHVSPGASAVPKKTEVPLGTKSDSAANSQPRPFFFDFNDIRNSAPFTGTNSSGINNLGDVHATLPFESRAKQPQTTQRDIRPRDLRLPNPPKRPTAPTPTLVQPGSAHLFLPRDRWNWYVSAMGTYMHEWNNFNRRMLLHFNTRQEAIETGLAPGWISAVGDSTRLRMNGNDEDSENGKLESGEGANGVENDDSLVPGGAKGGFNAYLRGIEEDVRVRKHWDVACEMHRECIIELGRLREWIRNGGKVA